MRYLVFILYPEEKSKDPLSKEGRREIIRLGKKLREGGFLDYPAVLMSATGGYVLEISEVIHQCEGRTRTFSESVYDARWSHGQEGCEEDSARFQRALDALSVHRSTAHSVIVVTDRTFGKGFFNFVCGSWGFYLGCASFEVPVIVMELRGEGELHVID